MLKIEHLTKVYGDKKAVNDLSLHIAPGEIYGFIGHNGAGKTTTLKSTVGILQFDEGEITINGISIKENPLECKKQIAYISDYYLQTVPESVKAAWQETLEETGFNPFQTDIASTLTQLSVELDFLTGGDDNIFGEIKASHILIKVDAKDNATDNEKKEAEKNYISVSSLVRIAVMKYLS